MTSFGEQWDRADERCEARASLARVLGATAFGFAFGALAKPLMRAVGIGQSTMWTAEPLFASWPWWALALGFGLLNFLFFAVIERGAHRG
jgi:hypothetical protein